MMVFNGTSADAAWPASSSSSSSPRATRTPTSSPRRSAEAEQRQTSVVMYRGGSARSVAQDVGSALGIEQVERLDAATQTSLKSLPESQQKDWNVVVIVGVDKSTQ